MKRLIFVFLLLPVVLFAQIDPKYGIGAVPEVDGRVVFSRSLDVPGYTQEQIFQAMKLWAECYFVATQDLHSRVLISNQAEGQIVAQGQQYLVFTNKAFSLDRALVSYQMYINCADAKCDLSIKAIRYLYNTGASKPETIMAEEQILDIHTFNKAKTKMIRATGKFRTHTIDMVEQVFDEAAAALGIQKVQPVQQQPAPKSYLSSNSSTTQSQPVVETVVPAPAPVSQTPNIPAVATSAPLAGYKQIDPQKIPGNIIKTLMDDWMLITAGNDSQYNMMTASWGGLGHLYNKAVAFCFINPTRYTYQLMEKNDTYTLSFYTETYRDALNYCGSHTGKNEDKVKASGLTPITTPSGAKAFSEAWMIIECRKLVSQSFIPEAISSDEVKEKWASKQLHKMYIGEILNVWVK